jgi:CDP-paratose 2-epimerase
MKWLITGGAGFIGCNVALRLLADGHHVVVFDNLARRGAAANLRLLEALGPCSFIRGDVRDFSGLAAALRSHPDTEVVLHLAAQVAVTVSILAPRDDFEINALGTFNVCEAVRQLTPEAVLLNASTNKVYGELSHVAVVQRNGHYEYRALPLGVSENEPLDFHSPYGCSKGAGDQYVRDYARIYGLRTVTLRQSCIFGPHQFGIEDQGWVAWFVIAAVSGRPITIYGDGRQVRDVLFIDDLVQCYMDAVRHIDRACGEVYNVGGGPGHVVSLLDVIALLEAVLGTKIHREFADWRPGDQRVFVSDIRKAKQDLEWQPRISTDEGIKRLADWVITHRDLLDAC